MAFQIMPSNYQVENFLSALFEGPKIKYQSLRNLNNEARTFRVVPLRPLAVFTLALPFSSFMFCITWSLMFNFTDSTSTHCGVSNYLPSVSSSIGSFVPQKFVWRLGISLHSAPRYLFCYIYFLLRHQSRFLLSLNIIEISALLGLTIVSSTEHFGTHACFFLLFIVTSFVGMTAHLLQPSLWCSLKLKIFLVNTLSWMLALFFYFVHNLHCRRGIYTLFALSEYVFVLSNMIFNFQAYYDFADFEFSVVRRITLLSSNSKFSV